MKSLLRLSIFFLLLFCCGCSKRFHACIRNLSQHPAIVDVYLLNTTQMKTLPNAVRVANRIINIKKAYAGQMDSSQLVHWVTTTHFQLTVKPQTTVDLSDMVGMFVNGRPRQDARLIVSVNEIKDTLYNGMFHFQREKFGYHGSVFNPKLYYDIAPQ